VVANLPYGKRVGDPDDLPPLYLGLGLMLRESAPGWRVALLHMAPELEPTLALRDATSTLFENGGIRCQLLVGTV
jgi:putative N6-adenine-specific DNA methylase